MIDGKPVLLFLDDKWNGACSFYRLVQPYKKIQELELFPCALASELDQEDFELWLDKADVIFAKIATPKLYEYLKTKPKEKKVVMDLDDNVFAVDPFNPAYEKRGIKEVDYNMPDGTVVKLRDGDGGFNIDENKQGLALYRECISRSDLVVCPTPILSGFLKRFNGNTKVIRNFLDFRVWAPLNLVKDEFVRIGYQGGYAHFQDFWEVRNALLEVMMKYQNTKLVLMGQVYEGALQGFPQDRIEKHGWTGVEAYPWKYKSLNIDIGIAPLLETEFNYCKSELKHTEYSALGIPSVCTNCVPYSLRVRHGITGYLAKGYKDWVKTLSDLVESKELRKLIGNQARDHVKENYDIDVGIHEYVTAVNSLFGMRELILN